MSNAVDTAGPEGQDPAAELRQLRAENTRLRQRIDEQDLRFETLIEGSRAGYWTWDIASEEMFLSPGALAIFGISATTVQNRHDLRVLILPDDLTLVARVREQHILSKGRIPFRCTFRARHREGGIIWVHSFGRIASWTPDGRPSLMFGCCFDVTREQEQQQAFEASFEQLHLILSNIHAGIWDHNVETGEAIWSDRLYEILGYEAGALPASRETLYQLMHPDDREKVRLAARNHFEEGLPYRVEFRVRHQHGHYHWVEAHGTCTRATDGQPLRMIGAMLDIQDRKEKELALERQSYHLHEVTRLAMIGSWELDFVNETLYWSPEVREMHGVASDFKPDLLTGIDFYVEEDRPTITEAVKQCRLACKPFELQLRLQPVEGEIFWARARGEPVLDSKGEVVKLRGILQNIDEPKRRELELRRTLEVVSKQNTRLTHFAHIVTHNLRTHTGNLRSLLDLYRTEDDAEMREELIELFGSTSETLFSTIEELSELVKVQSQVEQERAVLAFEDVLQKVKQILASEVEALDAQIEADFSAAPQIAFVPAYLESIFLNMASNALKYRSPERVPLLRIRSRPLPGGHVELAFRDNGQGIDLQRHGHKLFGLYQTFHRNADAHGVGLFLVKSQVESQGGSVSVRSEVDVGTTFTFVL
ncbi:MAG: PAS domain-containing protein [Verrucomicrobiota bacterium JB022]|nr:PAS domain-containing protein [Verrucomicrobiota bacterium JB022]